MPVAMLAPVNWTRIGAALRAIRRHRGWTLARGAAVAGISAATASRIENGRLDLVSLESVEAYARGLGADIWGDVRWRGGNLDRLLNRRHSAMHERMASMWRDLPGWVALPEVSFSIYGERGIIDWFAWHDETSTILIEELKSQLVDVQELAGTNDRRIRLGPQIARDHGWRPKVVASWVLLDDTRTNRRHLAQHRTFLRTGFPADGRTMAAWLRRPDGPIRCLSFLPASQDTKRRRGPGVQLIVPSGELILSPRVDRETLAGSALQDPADFAADERMAGFLRE